MGDSKEFVFKLPSIENLGISYWKGYGAYGIMGAVIVSILVPLVLSSIFFGKKRLKQRGIPVEASGEPGYAVRNAQASELAEVPWPGVTTMAALFEQTCRKHSHKQFLGTRKLIGREFVTSSDGRKFEKLHLGDYEWKTFENVFDTACNFASGLVRFGHNEDTRAAIFAETREEWFIALQGCFRQNITVVTIYSSLGEDALIHSLNETQVSTLICDSRQLKKLASIGSNLSSIQNVIYFEDDETKNEVNLSGSTSLWNVASFAEVVNLGKENPILPNLPSKNNIAVVMYTSGSTGLPKGVMITHGNIVATTAGVMTVIPPLTSEDAYLAYLPLAHVFELAAESLVLAAGCKIGYGSPLTLTDTSNKIKKGTKGDVSALRPTVMAAVPAIVDRIRDAVLKKVEEKGGLRKNLFNIGYRRRLAAIDGSWLGAWGLERFLWDKLVFAQVRSVLGGRLRYMLCGGAPLSGDTQRFTNICIGAFIGQAYGLTETFAGGAFIQYDDTTVGRVGPPLPCCYIKLVSWEEGGYMTSDKPMPRGEIVIGGYSVTAGYFKNDEKTNEVYKVDEKGIRWFYTGDIGKFHPDGCLEIIDRKKDIVKLQHGEYISLGKVEAALILSNYVDNIMVYADPFHNYCVALVVPQYEALKAWAQQNGIEFKDFSELCEKSETVKEVQQSIAKEKGKYDILLVQAAKEARLDKFEVPGKIKLLPEAWTPEAGLVTAALKIKREQIKSKFKGDLEKLYK